MKIKKTLILTCISVILNLLLVSSAFCWWSENWQYRKKITFDTTPVGADITGNLKDYPVLVRLHSGIFDFNNARDDGEDIRFISGDDKTPIKYHIEKYDRIDEIAIIWVKVPRIAGNSSIDSIYMYYGNDAAAGGQDSGGTYDINQIGVYHVGEIEGAPRDSTAFENHPSQFNGTLGLPGVIGNGLAMNGGGDRIVIPASPSLELKTGFTLSAWIRIMQPQQDGYLFYRGSEERSLVVGVDGTKIYARLSIGKEDKEKKTSPKIIETDLGADLSLQTWQYLSLTMEPDGSIKIYLDGMEMTSVDLPVKIPEFNEDIFVGDSPESEHPLIAELDEITLSNIPRNSDWIRAARIGQGPDSSLLTVEIEEVGEGGGSPNYMGVIVDNISSDGWIIITILVIFALFSWIIFLNKAFTMMLVQKEDRAFMKEYEEQKDILAIGSGESSYNNSALFRIYAQGREFLTRCMTNPDFQKDEICLNSNQMDGFKASVEKAYSDVNQRLNSWIVVLTMAISGGPFLGLLGTVWGVMNTFAAMAMAGEANIMAIAPGIASALATTVFGLIVAIPALFSYNYLAVKIQSINADTDVFIDEFVVKISGIYGEKK